MLGKQVGGRQQDASGPKPQDGGVIADSRHDRSP
jgi:hypothetical protein